jgi:hypothetical protein
MTTSRRWETTKLLIAAVLGAIGSVLVGQYLTNSVEASPMPEAPPDVRLASIELTKLALPVLGEERKERIAQMRSKAGTVFLSFNMDYQAPLLVDDPDVRALIMAARRSGQVSRLDTADVELNIGSWAEAVHDYYKAAAQFQVDIKLLQGLSQALRDERLPIENRRVTFKTMLFDHAYSRSTFNTVVGALHRNRGNPLTKALQEYAASIKTENRARVWPYRTREEDKTYLFDLGTAIFVIDFDEDGSGERAALATWVADVLSMLDVNFLPQLLEFSVNELKGELDVQAEFMAASNAVLDARMAPQIVARGNIYNPSRFPITVAPIGALEIHSSDGTLHRQTVAIRSFGEHQRASIQEELEKRETELVFGGKGLQYVTVDPGEVVPVELSGQYFGTRELWSRLQSAFDASILKASLTIETIQDVKSTSPLVRFGRVSESPSEQDLERLLR